MMRLTGNDSGLSTGSAPVLWRVLFLSDVSSPKRSLVLSNFKRRRLQEEEEFLMQLPQLAPHLGHTPVQQLNHVAHRRLPYHLHSSHVSGHGQCRSIVAMVILNGMPSKAGFSVKSTLTRKITTESRKSARRPNDLGPEIPLKNHRKGGELLPCARPRVGLGL